jgi:hypothetical protein
MRRLVALALLLVPTLASLGCRAPYPAPQGRTLPSLSSTRWARSDSGDRPAIERAEQACLSGLSPRAVSVAFQAVDEVAQALVNLCSIELVGDDPLLWHVWCGSDALFDSGHYLALGDRSVACDGSTARNAFECIGRILSRHLLTPSMREHVQGVEIVSIGSVDRQRLSTSSAFLTEPCTELQGELGLGAGTRWSVPETPPSEDERARLWNQRLSWCRAAFSARELRSGMSAQSGATFTLGAVGAGSDWLDSRGRCPTREGRPEQCSDARRVDLFVRVGARQGTGAPQRCQAPAQVTGGESGRALYCYADCQARAATGRNVEGYQAPRSAADLLFGAPRSATPEGWIVDRSTSGTNVSTGSVRDLFLRDSSRASGAARP